MAKRTYIEQTLKDEAETRAFAERLAPLLRAGDVLLLSGDIGAGKTSFARALIQHRLQASGRMEDVPSPTFTLVQTYDDGVAEIVHADLYRLGSVAETDELGLADAFETAICLIEWPDRLEGAVPDSALSLHLEIGENPDERHLTLTAQGGDWAARLAAVHTETAAG